MKEKFEMRIKELKIELESGQKAMSELDARRTDIMYALLRISGAVQALEELLLKDESVHS